MLNVINYKGLSHGVMSDSRRYWSDLKRKLSTEGFSQLYEIIVQLKLISSDFILIRFAPLK